jgi:hypothetical protein
MNLHNYEEKQKQSANAMRNSVYADWILIAAVDRVDQRIVVSRHARGN